jgi:phage terminase large subunit-like protein
MSRTLIVIAVVGLLVACTPQGDGNTDASAGGAATSAAASAGASGVASTASAACEEAFAAIAELEIGSISDLGDLPEELRPTIEGCESVADWVAGAGQAIGIEVNPNTARLLLDINCADQSLADTPICEELASS